MSSFSEEVKGLQEAAAALTVKSTPEQVVAFRNRFIQLVEGKNPEDLEKSQRNWVTLVGVLLTLYARLTESNGQCQTKIQELTNQLAQATEQRCQRKGLIVRLSRS